MVEFTTHFRWPNARSDNSVRDILLRPRWRLSSETQAPNQLATPEMGSWWDMKQKYRNVGWSMLKISTVAVNACYISGFPDSRDCLQLGVADTSPPQSVTVLKKCHYPQPTSTDFHQFISRRHRALRKSPLFEGRQLVPWDLTWNPAGCFVLCTATYINLNAIIEYINFPILILNPYLTHLSIYHVQCGTCQNIQSRWFLVVDRTTQEHRQRHRRTDIKFGW